MFERFSEPARQVVVLAQDEARLFKHNHIGTEHLLLGLLREEQGLAGRVLDALDITVEEVHLQVARIVGQGDEVTTGQIPFTPRAKKVLELALREALSFGHDYIGTEHILLGLVREDNGVGARILLNFGVNANSVRIDIVRLLSGPGRQAAVSRPADFNVLPERFTERARQVIVLAEDEARSLNHNCLNTEHLLLGILRDEHGLAARVLHTLDITIDEVRAQVIETVGRGDEPVSGAVPLTSRAEKVLDLALREALSLGHHYVGTEHILLGLVRETKGVGAQILLASDADAETIRNQIIGMLSGPSQREQAPTGTARFFFASESERRSVVTQRYDDSASIRLLVACPACATPIERATTDQRHAEFRVSMQGNHACPGCGRRWAITVTAAWTDPAPPANPEEDFPGGMSVYGYAEPAHFSMTCFRCGQALERITLDETTTSPRHIEGEGDRACPSCRKAWRISYTVRWEERPSASSASGG
jgi:ATP-dependent Clp protease ATP-binding subunit ClpA